MKIRAAEITLFRIGLMLGFAIVAIADLYALGDQGGREAWQAGYLRGYNDRAELEIPLQRKASDD